MSLSPLSWFPFPQLLLKGTVLLPHHVTASPTPAKEITLPGFAQQHVPLHLGPERRATLPSQMHRSSQKEDLLLCVYHVVAVNFHSALLPCCSKWVACCAGASEKVLEREEAQHCLKPEPSHFPSDFTVHLEQQETSPS